MIQASASRHHHGDPGQLEYRQHSICKQTPSRMHYKPILIIIIFWYDEDKEFEDKLDEVVLENAKVIELTGNNVFCRNLYEARRTNEYVQS